MRYLILICLVFLISCSKSSDPTPAITTLTITAKDFVGTWLGSAGSVTGCPNPIGNSTEQPCGAGCNSYTFTLTTATFNILGFPSGPYTIKGDSILMPFMAPYLYDKRKFTLVENKLTLSSGTTGLNAGCVTNLIYLKN